MKNFILDAHNDCAIKKHNINQLKKYYISLEKSNANTISAIWTTELTGNVMQKVEMKTKMIDIASNLKSPVAIEDFYFATRQNLARLISLKPCYVSLTWNYNNVLAGGCYDNSGITEFGKIVIKTLEEHNIQIDASHLNEHSFMNLAHITSKPLFCSHTAFNSVNNHQRNLKDYQLKMIVDSGGLVGLCLVSDFLNGTHHANINDIIKHIDYFNSRYGIDNLCIGTDFNGTKHLPKGIKNYKNLYLLKYKLKEKGYTESSLNKLFHDNLYNFLFN
ncbi:MAG: membrane dipeptidase [Clostridia bacterium]